MSQTPPRDGPPRLLPDATAIDLMRRGLFFTVISIVCAVGMVIGSTLDPPVRPTVVIAAFVGLLVSGVIGTRTYLLEMGAEHRERDAGYTTLLSRRYRDYWQLDPRSGVVVRRPGEDRKRPIR
jgi:hypothetical protein